MPKPLAHSLLERANRNKHDNVHAIIIFVDIHQLNVLLFFFFVNVHRYTML